MRKAFIIGAFLASTASTQAIADVNIYSSRKEHLIKPVLEEFTKDTGIKTNLLTEKAPNLIARLEREGTLSPADVLVTVDLGNLHKAKAKDLLQPIQNETILEKVPAHLKDADKQWAGLTKRARAIFYNKEKLAKENLPATYEELQTDKFKNNVLIRSSSNIYNQSLLSSLIHHLGKESALDWAKGVVKNFARKPQGGDTDQLKALAAGEGTIAVANTYYYGRLAGSDNAATKALADKIGIIFPNQNGRGAHVNVSGAGITKHAPNKEEAEKLIAYLLSPKAQEKFAELNYEYPVIANAKVPALLESWGEFKEDRASLSILGEQNAEAVRIFDQAGWE